MTDYDRDIADIIRQLNQSTGYTGGEEEQRAASAAGFGQLLSAAIRRNASDLLLVSGAPPIVRVNGELEPLSEDVLDPEQVQSLVFSVLGEHKGEAFSREQAVDFCFALEGIGRFRCNIHRQRGHPAAAIRLFPHVLPRLADLNLPEAIRKFSLLNRGLVLVTGPAGSGKSTTLAALIDIINRERKCHIITIEDPVEYQHAHRQSLIEHVEVGRDAVSFSRALRDALRQDPDVILLGEMRDLETIATAMTGAETGHLIFSTLHTNDTSQTIDRIIDVFPAAQQNQIRQQLSFCLAGIVTQQLIPLTNGSGRVPAAEVLFTNDAIRNHIRNGKTHMIHSHLTMGKGDGMVTLEESLASLYLQGKIRYEDALYRSQHREEFEGILAKQGGMKPPHRDARK
jgi:twitching motility protein PilT